MPLPSQSMLWPPLELEVVHFAMERWSAWYSGDPHQLDEVYLRDHRSRHNHARPRPSTTRGGIVGAVARTFWGAPRTDLTQPKSKLHVPLAGDICQASADLLFSEPPTITVPDKTTNDRIQELVGDGMLSTLAESAELAAALGGTYVRVTWDLETEPDGPFLTAVDADGAWPEFRWGRMIAVTFWTDVTPAEKRSADIRLRHLERHEVASNGNGIILHGLYEGTRDNLGRQVPLTEETSTQALADIVADGDMIDTLSPGLAVVYVPNQRPQRRWRHDAIGRHLGRSDLDGVEGLMDSLDETFTSWMRDIRLGKARVFIAESMLDDLGAGRGTAWDADKEIYAPVKALFSREARGLPIQAEQFEIRYAEHEATAKALIENILRTAGYSTQTFGMDSNVQGAATATEVIARQQRSYMTRDRKVRLWRPAIEDLIEKLMAVDAAVFGNAANTDDVEVQFNDGIQETPTTLAATAATLASAQIASKRTLVQMIHPDWTDDQIASEVTALAGEETARMAAGALSDPAGSFGVSASGGIHVPGQRAAEGR